jgi:hypothetical protein
MTRLLYNQASKTTAPYPRADDEPVIGLDRTQWRVVELVEQPQPALQAGQVAELVETLAWLPTTNAHGVDGTLTRTWKVKQGPPQPDWIRFDIAIQNDPAIVAAINDLGRLKQVTALSLGHALEEAERGALDRFLPIWTEWLIATNPPAATLDRFRALAAAHHLPADFQASIAAPPAGPAVAP